MSRRVMLLFDVDGTLTKSRNEITESMKQFMLNLCDRLAVGLVGGSDIHKITEQLGEECNLYSVVAKADYAFGENGCVGLRKGEQFHEESISQALGEETLKRFINFCLHYIADLDIPIKRGTFIEYRKGMLNVSPIGRNCSQRERDEFFEYDKQHKIRETFRQVLTENFGPIGMQFSIGGQISVDAFPTGWDKTHCLGHLAEYEHIYFFGDRTEPGGNDYELYMHPRVKSFSVTGPEDTQGKVTELVKELES